MIEIVKKYEDKLSAIIDQIQQSELLASYLDEEDEEVYGELKEQYEPMLNELHEEVADNDPLQLESLERHMLNPALEGLYLPRILGYSVLRGAISDDYRYIRPQEHFKTVLMAICNSSNFDLLKQRIGQTIEMGFALSSDIWITNLIAELNNKQVKSYLYGLKDLKYRDVRSRHTMYAKYSRQFEKFNFLTANMPSSAPELKIEYRSLKNFLNFRASKGSDSVQSMYGFISNLLKDASLGQSKEHLEIIMMIGSFFDLKDVEKKILADRLSSYEGGGEDEQLFFDTLMKLQAGEHGLSDEDYARLNSIVSTSKSNKFKDFLDVVNQINDIGYMNPEAIEVARAYYNSNQGLSVQNECLRNVISTKFSTYLRALSVEDFHDYFEVNKVFTTYMNIFVNEKFNQYIKADSLRYVKALLRRYTEKRSKDYQDIKKFVTATFSDLGFLTEKELKDLFKTKRKKKVTT